MTKRGRPRSTERAQKIADDVAARLFVERDRVLSGQNRAKGQQRIGSAFLKDICERVGKRHGVSARTVEKYFYRHRESVNTRYVEALEKRLKQSDEAEATERRAKLRQIRQTLM